MILIFLSSTIGIVTSTSDIYSVAYFLAPGNMIVENIVPGGMCPGHFDLSPVEADKISSSKIILAHGWESWLKKVKEINPSIDMIILKTEGNWMIPSIYLKGAEEIYSDLKRRFSGDSVFIDQLNKNFKRLKTTIEITIKITNNEKEKLKGVKVICNAYIKDFLTYLGMDVVATFPPGDEVNVKDISDAVKKGKKEGVVLVVSNLQSGKKVGWTIARELGVNQVIISNFPVNSNYRETLLEDIDSLIKGTNNRNKKS